MIIFFLLAVERERDYDFNSKVHFSVLKVKRERERERERNYDFSSKVHFSALKVKRVAINGCPVKMAWETCG